MNKKQLIITWIMGFLIIGTIWEVIILIGLLI